MRRSGGKPALRSTMLLRATSRRSRHFCGHQHRRLAQRAVTCSANYVELSGHQIPISSLYLALSST